MFGAQVMRLMREKWKSPMALAQEIYAILQSDIPLTHSGPMTLKQREESSQAPLTIRTFGGGTPALRFVNSQGVEIGGFTLDNGTMVLTGQARKAQKCRCPERGPFLPAIVWVGPAEFPLGGQIVDGRILNAFALDPRTLDNPFPTVVPGTFLYSPPAGTLLTAQTNVIFTCTFTPTDTVTFRSDATSEISVNVDTIRVSSGDFASGNLIVVKVAVVTANELTEAEPANSTVTVSDAAGNPYAQAGSYQSVWAGVPPVGIFPGRSKKHTVSIWYAQLSTPVGAIPTITVTPSDGTATFVADLVANAKTAPLDGTATHSDFIDDTPETLETGLIASSANPGEFDLFMGTAAYVDAQFILASGFGFTPFSGHDAHNLTALTTQEQTTPLSQYAALGVSFRQKPAT